MKKQQQPRKKRVRKVKSNRGYFMNTSDEESESVDDPGVATPSSTPRGSLASRGQRDSISSSALGDEDLGHPAKRSRRSTRSASSQEEEQPTSNENSLLKNKTGASTGPSTPSVEVVAGPGESLTGSTAAVFPPGLLAANPSLANAATGSLVVVGGDHGGHNASEQVSSSPSNSNHQLLHVSGSGMLWLAVKPTAGLQQSQKRTKKGRKRVISKRQRVPEKLVTKYHSTNPVNLRTLRIMNRIVETASTATDI